MSEREKEREIEYVKERQSKQFISQLYFEITKPDAMDTSGGVMISNVDLQTFIEWRPASRKSRREQVVISRLRIGHTRLTHSFRNYNYNV